MVTESSNSIMIQDFGPNVVNGKTRGREGETDESLLNVSEFEMPLENLGRDGQMVFRDLLMRNWSNILLYFLMSIYPKCQSLVNTAVYH